MIGVGEGKGAEKKHVKKDAKHAVNLKRERLKEERERLREEREDVNFTDATTWALSLFLGLFPGGDGLRRRNSKF